MPILSATEHPLVKQRIIKIMKSCILALLAGCCWAGGLTAPQQKLVATIESKLLAPCCYAGPVGSHQSEVAVKMRMEIARLVEAGQTEAEIVDLYVQRYGAKVVAGFAPTPGWAQYLPWLLTSAGTVLLAGWIWRKVRRRTPL
jgi:cytochrome c-type biogenesis protein CcmH